MKESHSCLAITKMTDWSLGAFSKPFSLDLSSMFSFKRRCFVVEVFLLFVCFKRVLLFNFRYFMHGLCKEGDNCRYSHDLTNSKPAAMICKFFQKGNCVFGERCR